MKKALLLAICISLFALAPVFAYYNNDFETAAKINWIDEGAASTGVFACDSSAAHSGSACMKVTLTYFATGDEMIGYEPYPIAGTDATDTTIQLWVMDSTVGTGKAFQVWASDGAPSWSWYINIWNNDIHPTWENKGGAASGVIANPPVQKLGIKIYGLTAGTYIFWVDDLVLGSPAAVDDWAIMAK